MAKIETDVYTISRTQLAYWTAFEYIRRFWPAFIAFPITGVLLFIFIPMREIQVLGMVMFLWPLSIPARSILITSRATRRALKPTKMVMEGDHAYFVTEPVELNYRIHKDQIRDVKIRVEYVVIELWKYRLVFIPYRAFSSPEVIQEFRRAVDLVD